MLACVHSSTRCLVIAPSCLLKLSSSRSATAQYTPCVLGMNRPRPMLALELCDGVDEDPGTSDKICEALQMANQRQPKYSVIQEEHVILMPANTLPRTVKGTITRFKCERLLRGHMDALYDGSLQPELRRTKAATIAKNLECMQREVDDFNLRVLRTSFSIQPDVLRTQVLTMPR